MSYEAGSHNFDASDADKLLNCICRGVKCENVLHIHDPASYDNKKYMFIKKLQCFDIL